MKRSVLASLSAAPSRSLRHAVTRVRQADGRLFEEERLADGSIARRFVGREAAPPPLLPQAEDYRPVTFYAFHDGKWAPWTGEEQEEEEEGEAVERKEEGPLRLLTWNVWFSQKHQKARYAALRDIVREQRPSVVALQEVTPTFLHWVLADPFWRANYAVSDNEKAYSVHPYGVAMMLARSAVVRCPTDARLYDLPTRMARRFLVAPGVCGFTVGTVHLESLDNADVRTVQLRKILGVLDASTDGSALLCGDCNFDDDARLERAVLDDFPAFEDVGAGGGRTMHEYPGRIDRIFVKGAAPAADGVRLLGEEPFATAGRTLIYPSDHKGLVVSLLQSSSK